MAETAISGRVKSFPLIKKPMDSGTTMAARLPMKLNTPPVRPIRRSGAIA
jgi:hypothetical protein